MPIEGEVIANRFRLVRELGRGSMGTVWLAHHLTLEMPCAVKFIANEGTNDSNHRARFHIEARTIAQINSPNVVRVLDHELSNDRPSYIAMEFLDGEDLWSRLQRLGRLDADATYAIVSQVARGLSRAHRAGIVHRDLKPENIFIAHEGDESVAKLLDFGIAKWTAFSPENEAAGLFGTPEYMSPEQARGAPTVDYRADLWSLAVITYQCLAGQLPFSGATVPELLAHITMGRIPIPSEVAPDLSPHFDCWWARATSRTIDERFPNALELADSLGRALGISGEQPAAATLPNVPPGLPSTPESCVLPAYRPSRSRTKQTSFPAAAAGLIAALVAMLAGAGHDPSSLARANLGARRIIAVESPRFAYVPSVRTEATKAASPPSTASTATLGDPGHDVTPEKLVAYAPRLRGVVRPPAMPRQAPPKTEAPKAAATPETEAHPNTVAHPDVEDDDAVLDLGI